MPDPLQQESSELVVYAARLVRAVRRRVELPQGMRILSLLDELGPQGVTALATADRSAQPTMSGAVRQLEALGWVAKGSDPDDARRSVVTLTDEGRVRLEAARHAGGVAVAERVRRTQHSATEVATAVSVLRDVLAEEL